MSETWTEWGQRQWNRLLHWQSAKPTSAAPLPTYSDHAPVIRGIDGQASFLDSATLAKTRAVYWHKDGRPDFVLDRDPRLERIVQEVKIFQRGDRKFGTMFAGSAEKRLVETAVQLINKEYGDYNPGVANALTALAGVKVNDSATYERATHQLHQSEDSHERLSELPKGKSVCRQRAAILSYVLEQVGVHNFYVLGNMTQSAASYVINNDHAWVVSKKTGNILDPSAPSYASYKTNLQHVPVHTILAGAPVIVSQEYGGASVYGTGFRNSESQRALLAAREKGNLETVCWGNYSPIGEPRQLDNYQQALLKAAGPAEHVFPDTPIRMNPLAIHGKPGNIPPEECQGPRTPKILPASGKYR